MKKYLIEECDNYLALHELVILTEAKHTYLVQDSRVIFSTAQSPIRGYKGKRIKRSKVYNDKREALAIFIARTRHSHMLLSRKLNRLNVTIEESQALYETLIGEIDVLRN